MNAKDSLGLLEREIRWIHEHDDRRLGNVFWRPLSHDVRSLLLWLRSHGPVPKTDCYLTWQPPAPVKPHGSQGRNQFSNRRRTSRLSLCYGIRTKRCPFDADGMQLLKT